MAENFKTWDQYVDEADVPDFVVRLPGDKGDLRVTNPTGARLMRIAQGTRSGDLEVVLAALTGDAWPTVEELLQTSPGRVMAKLTEDIMDHFKLYEPVTLVNKSGNKVTETRPTQVQKWLDRGYRPVGEGQGSRG